MWLIGLSLIVYYLINLYQFVTKSYYVDETKLYQVDTFHLLNRGYIQTNPNGKTRYGSPELVFKSINGYSFAIKNDVFESIIDKQELQDTLMYNDLKFTVFSDKKTFQKYNESKKPIFIKLYQLQIGSKKYIDISKLNAISKGEMKRAVLIPPVFILFLAFLLFKQNANENWWTKRKIIILCIAFIVTIISLLILT